jgi:hypothetical protein
MPRSAMDGRKSRVGGMPLQDRVVALFADEAGFAAVMGAAR